ncbi:VOC family protein [Roseomonas arctica]|uniref:VOC family protein n=1 Tax=Plastoroseomonas arctica TaxID=1509237 RepID=A0AAF1KN33_9PROT|nr:VOC family protein [Plastoroseomonas arctica]MBR0654088.1 VOC family protein [Plastoroseomonas arctica]
MSVRAIVAQLRATDREASIRFYTQRMGWALAWRFGDGYAAIEAAGQMVHIKHVAEPGPSIKQVAAAVISISTSPSMISMRSPRATSRSSSRRTTRPGACAR